MATNDFTNWGLFWHSYYNNESKSWWDSTIQTVMGNAYYLHYLYRIFSQGGSAVNAGTSNILLSFKPDTSFIKPIDNDTSDETKKTTIANRFGAAALFFAHLSSVVYESPEIIEKVAKKWGIEVQPIHKIDNSSAAYIFTVTSENENAVILVFKGTSPFNFTEWASDFGLGLEDPNDDLCKKDKSDATRIHGGFWNTIFGLEGQHDHKYWNSIIGTIKQLVNKIHRETNHEVPVYLTGHSLGAALASVALYVLTNTPELLNNKKTKLVGAFTYGTPNIGNCTFKDKYNINLSDMGVKHFRIGNANDVVSMAPRSYQNGGIAITLNHNGSPSLGTPWICRKVTNYFSALMSFPHTLKSLRGELKGVSPQEKDIYKTKLIQTEYYVNELLKKHITNYNGEQESYERKTNALGYIYKVLAPSWLLDHFPSEYIEHIENAKWSELPSKSLIFK